MDKWPGEMGITKDGVLDKIFCRSRETVTEQGDDDRAGGCVCVCGGGWVGVRVWEVTEQGTITERGEGKGSEQQDCNRARGR